MKKKTSPIMYILLIILTIALVYFIYDYTGGNFLFWKKPSSGSLSEAIETKWKPVIKEVEIEVPKEEDINIDNNNTESELTEEEEKELEKKLEKLKKEIQDTEEDIENRNKEIQDELFPTDKTKNNYKDTERTEKMIEKIKDEKLLKYYKQRRHKLYKEKTNVIWNFKKK